MTTGHPASDLWLGAARRTLCSLYSSAAVCAELKYLLNTVNVFSRSHGRWFFFCFVLFGFFPLAYCTKCVRMGSFARIRMDQWDGKSERVKIKPSLQPLWRRSNREWTLLCHFEKCRDEVNCREKRACVCVCVRACVWEEREVRPTLPVMSW